MKNIYKLLVCILIVSCSLMIMTSCDNATTSVSDAGSSYSNDEDYDDRENVLEPDEGWYNEDYETLEDYLFWELDAIPWEDADGYFEGEVVNLYGYVKSSKYAYESKGKPTFLNIGNAYPNSDRVTVVIWGENRNNFSVDPEDYYMGKLVVVSGEIHFYEGVPEIEVFSQNDIIVIDD